MTNLLIHSMTEFSSLILGCIERTGAQEIVEIGAEFGGMSQQLADHCAAVGGRLTSIDPAPKAQFVNWVHGCPHVRHIAATSLSAMAELADVDAWVIDGDHNYYTVYNELLLVDAASRRDGKPLLALMHDVSWPCARRDCYYAPNQIPEEDRHPYSYEGGVTLDDATVVPGRGFRGMGQFAWAIHEGGPRNGVLTAVEDFLEHARAQDEAEGRDRLLLYAQVPAVFGLGVLFDAAAEWAEDVAGLVLPYHENALIASLELNRLRNYLTVIDWQDRHAAGLAA
jgi:hypothetical protein